MVSRRFIGTSSGRHIWRTQDVVRRRPQDVDIGCPLALHIGPYGYVQRTSCSDVPRTSRDVILLSGKVCLGLWIDNRKGL